MSKKRRHEEHEEHADESWLIPYADLLTLLLALFIVLFASSQADTHKFDELSKAFSIALNPGNGILSSPTVIKNGESNLKKRSDDGEEKKNKVLVQQSQIKKETEELEKLKKKLDKFIKENGLSAQLDTKLNLTELMITISDNALYASGSAQVKQEAKKLAASIGTMLGQYPGYEIVVSGHTDNNPINTKEFESNWDLSYKRALNFMKILLYNSNLNQKQFTPIGYGEFHPIVENNTEGNRAKNRRVEVSIMRKFIDNTTHPVTIPAQ